VDAAEPGDYAGLSAILSLGKARQTQPPFRMASWSKADQSLFSR
jgi:hypothetical protein